MPATQLEAPNVTEEVARIFELLDALEAGTKALVVALDELRKKVGELNA